MYVIQVPEYMYANGETFQSTISIDVSMLILTFLQVCVYKPSLLNMRMSHTTNGRE
jgi:hypothetical protein